MNEGVDLVFSFDTTGSMYPCLAEVRRNIDQILDPLFAEIPGLRVGLIAHGDYCDRNSTYVITHNDLTTDKHQLKSFVRNVDKTGGGDSAECYELVLNRARTLSWSAGKSRVLVMIGDDVPHPPTYYDNTQRLDWTNEAKMLSELRVQCYTIQCLNNSYATDFWKSVAMFTNGIHLRLNQFRNIEALIKGVAFKQQGQDALDQYERFQHRQLVGRDLEDIFDRLQGRTVASKPTRTYTSPPHTFEPHSSLVGLVPVDPARFQVFDVPTAMSIRDFVESMGITFQLGRGFYPHISRPETIQEHKEVIIEDLTTGDMYTGSDARNKIGLPFGMRGTVKPNPLPGCRVWVQSTSNNRILRERAFMYEVPDKYR